MFYCLHFRHVVFSNNCVFAKNFQKFVTSTSPMLDCFYWLFRKWPAESNDCSLWDFLQAWLAPLHARADLQWIREKHKFLDNLCNKNTNPSNPSLSVCPWTLFPPYPLSSPPSFSTAHNPIKIVIMIISCMLLLLPQHKQTPWNPLPLIPRFC